MELCLPSNLLQDDHNAWNKEKKYQLWENTMKNSGSESYMENLEGSHIPFDVYISASIGDCQNVLKLITENKFDINKKNKGGWTPLMYAVSRGASEIVTTLLKNGANVHAQDKRGRNALMLATYGRDSLINVLVQNGCILEARDNNDWTALFHAIVCENYDVCHTLLMCGANPNACISLSFETPLMFAARVGNVHIVSLLLGAGANSNFKSNNGKTLVDYVDFAKFPEMGTVLEQHKSDTGVPSIRDGPQDYSAKTSRAAEVPFDLEILLNRLDLGSYYTVFQNEGVDMQTFLSLTDADLKSCGITKLGPRRKLLEAISRWHNNAPLRTGLEAAYANKLEIELSDLRAAFKQKLEPLKNENEQLNMKLEEYQEVCKIFNEKTLLAYHMCTKTPGTRQIQDVLISLHNFLKTLIIPNHGMQNPPEDIFVSR